MSYYNVYPNPTMDVATCSVCSTETFTWLAESFGCMVCGSEEFEEMDEDEDDEEGQGTMVGAESGRDTDSEAGSEQVSSESEGDDEGAKGR